jgi:hypothetical protein
LNDSDFGGGSDGLKSPLSRVHVMADSILNKATY